MTSRVRRILIMDDEKLIRDLASELLEQLGYDVSIAANGEEAIELYKEALDKDRRFDVIIVDLAVPDGMGGAEALGALMEIDPDVKAIASSGYLDTPVMRRHAAYGFKGILPKPYDAEQLADAIESIVGSDTDRGSRTPQDS